jgi:hypothetical protein
MLTDCPACPPGARGGRAAACAYTGGLPSLLRHAAQGAAAPPRALCADFAPPPGARECPREQACPLAHVMNPRRPADGGYRR